MTTSMRHTTRLTTSTAAVAAALALAGCAAGEPPASAAPQQTGDTARYCALVAEVNTIGERVFADQPEDAPPEEVGRRQGQLVNQAAAQLAEMERVAPPEIRSDVALFLDDLKARATTPEGTGRQEAEAAEERIRAFEEQNCLLGPDGS